MATKTNNQLDKELRFPFGIMTMRDAILGGYFSHSENQTVPGAVFSRDRYNRMTVEEQQDFDKRYAKKRMQYRLFRDDCVFITVSKTVFDFFNELKG